MKLIVLIVLCTSWSTFGQTSNTITAKSGQFSDVQAAVKSAKEGDTVIIPQGTYTWSSQLVIDGGTFSDGSPKGKSVNLFGGQGGVTILNNYKISRTWLEQQLVKVQTSPGSTFEMKGINFEEGPALAGAGSAGHAYLTVTYTGGWGQSADPKNRGKVALIHDCNFTSKGNISHEIRLNNRGGVIWKCAFIGKGTGNEVGIIYQGEGSWRQPSTMGALDTTGLGNTYVEDCTFSEHGNGYAFDVSAGARMVIRHCMFNAALIGSHGLESDPVGMRHAEAYNNRFFNTGGPSTYTWIHIRGGTWAIFGNTFGAGPGNVITFTVMALTRRAVAFSPPCPTKYPVPRQVGQGWSGGIGSFAYAGYPQFGDGNILDPVYIWQNTNNAGRLVAFTDDMDTCGNKLKTQDFVRAGRDYITDVPKPNYSAFTYPHPLRTATIGPPPPTTGVPTFVQSAKGPIPPSAVTTSSASFNRQNAGNSNIVVVSFGSTRLSSITVPTITVTDSQAPGVLYTQVTSAVQSPAGNGSVGFIVFRRIGLSAGPNTITARSNVANEFLDLGVMEYAHAGGAVNDIATGANPNTTGVSVSLAGTVNERNKLVLSAVAAWFGNPGNPTGGGFTTKLSFFKMNLSDQVTSAAGPVSVTYTIPIPGGGGWIGKLIAFGPS